LIDFLHGAGVGQKAFGPVVVRRFAVGGPDGLGPG
jgi:hypothetical protein